jgi:peptide/nickel transport system substrate-binding protein
MTTLNGVVFRGPRIAMCVLALALAATACGDDKSDNGTGQQTGTSAGGTVPATTAPPKKGGELTMLVNADPPGFDPVVNPASGTPGGSQSQAIFGYLVRLDNATGKFDMGTAESLEPSADFRTWALKLKPNIKFSDGTPYDAAAIKFNWDRVTDPKNASIHASAFTGLESLTVTDPLTVTIKFKDPTANFIGVVARRLGGIGSPKAIQEKGSGFTTAPVGAGPFMVESYAKDDKLVLVRNPTYYQADKGLPYLDRLIFRPIADEDQRFNTFNQGQAGAIFTATPATVVKINAANKKSVSFVGSGGTNINFNVTTKPFNDVRARKAFIMSVDLDTMNKVNYNGGAVVPKSGLMAKEHPLYAEAAWPQFDCNGAKALWAELAAANGNKPIEFAIGAFQGQSIDAEFFQASITQCSGGNAKVSTNIQASSAAIADVFAQKYQAHQWGHNIVYDPTAIMFQLKCDNPQNSTKYCSAEYDAAFNATASTNDLAKQKASWATAQQVLARDVPLFFYRRPSASVAYQDNVLGVSIFEDGVIKPELISLK